VVSNSGSHKKVANSLVALSSAAVLAVYTAGYVRTKSAADRFALQASVRRPVPAPPAAAPLPDDSKPAYVNAATPKTADLPRLKKDTVPARVPTAGTAAPRHRPDDAAVAGKISAKAKAGNRTAALKKVEPLPGATVDPPPAPLADPPSVAVESLPVAAPAPTAPAKPQYKDGTYLGWGTSRHGDIQAAVIVQDGRIASATIAQCFTRYSCSVIAKLPPQVAERQSPETDYVSGATQSTNAFYYAVVDALSKAK
jgi:uncharacterized protein with FMN-binding domain